MVLLELVYMRPKANSAQFEIWNYFEKLFHSHGDFVAVTFQTVARFHIAHVQMILVLLLAIIKTNGSQKIKD